MGLDLYKYKLSKTEDTSKIIFIGKDEKEYQSLFPLIKKTELSIIISKKEIDFSNFEEIFEFLEKLEPDNNYADELCCDSLY